MPYIVEEIVIQDEYGAAEGYVAPTAAEQLHIWLQHRHRVATAETVAADLRRRYLRFAVLNNINVIEDKRGMGHGGYLLEAFLDEAGAVPVLLIADTGEGQAEGFSLVAWYEGYGFTVVCDTGAGPLMIRYP